MSEPKQIKIPGPSVGYTDLIDQAMAAAAEEDAQVIRFPLRPSSSGYCGRRLAYDLMQYRGYATYPREVKEPETVRLLNLGSSVEWHSIKNFELIDKVIPGTKVRYKQQTVTLFRLEQAPSGATPELIEGSLDLTLVLNNAGGLGDVKSRKDKFHQAFKTDWDATLDKLSKMGTLVQISATAWYAPDLIAFLDELNDPFFADNFFQTNSYLCTDWAKEHGLDHGFIYRYCKNDSRHLEIRFPPTPELFDYVRAKFNEINKAVDQKKPELVPQEYVLGSARCAFCPYQKQCWGDVDALKAWFASWPKKKWPTDVRGQLAADFEEYEKAAGQADLAERFEEKIVKQCIEQKMEKVRLPNGNIYQIKPLKERVVLRRSKL